jgi:hypothetical protein
VRKKYEKNLVELSTGFFRLGIFGIETVLLQINVFFKFAIDSLDEENIKWG